jgi:hypothetical protein
MFGDSILASSTPIQKDLENHIHKSLKNYATIGSSLQDGWVISIPEQYNKNKLPILKTIIMDGGGNYNLIAAATPTYVFSSTPVSGAFTLLLVIYLAHKRHFSLLLRTQILILILPL